VERTLGLICGAGALPHRMAAAARGLGWRVVAFTFDGAPDMDGHVARVAPSRLSELGELLATLKSESVVAVVFSGRFSLPAVLRTDVGAADSVARGVVRTAGSWMVPRVLDSVVGMFASVGVEVLDQRPFLGDLLAPARCWTAREPTPLEWRDIRRGLGLARTMAAAAIGQTVVLRDGAVTAVEAVEGTTEAIRRGASLGGPGAVVVKAVGPAHDYRFDVPAVGIETVEVATAGGVAVVAIEAGRVAILDREAVVAAADRAGIGVISVDEPA
jgi:DUF1009 family protein